MGDAPSPDFASRAMPMHSRISPPSIIKYRIVRSLYFITLYPVPFVSIIAGEGKKTR